MQIAIPSNDGRTVCNHAGRATGCVVVDVPATGDPRVTYRSKADYAPGETNHHLAIRKLVEGCQVFLCAGMGAGLYNDLLASGVQVLVTRESDAAAAAEKFLAGDCLPVTELACADAGQGCDCDCHHD